MDSVETFSTSKFFFYFPTSHLIKIKKNTFLLKNVGRHKKFNIFFFNIFRQFFNIPPATAHQCAAGASVRRLWSRGAGRYDVGVGRDRPRPQRSGDACARQKEAGGLGFGIESYGCGDLHESQTAEVI